MCGSMVTNFEQILHWKEAYRRLSGLWGALSSLSWPRLFFTLTDIGENSRVLKGGGLKSVTLSPYLDSLPLNHWGRCISLLGFL